MFFIATYKVRTSIVYSAYGYQNRTLLTFFSIDIIIYL